MEGVEAQERLVRNEGKWGHGMSDFKKLWHFNMDHEISDACQFSQTLPLDEQELLLTFRRDFDGAHVLPLRDGEKGDSTCYMLTPPVPRNATLDQHVNSLAQKVQQSQWTVDPKAYHIVGMASAGHSLAAGIVGEPSVTYLLTRDSTVPARAWKEGVSITARNNEPPRPGLVTANVSPAVPAKGRTHTPDVKATPSRNIPLPLDYSMGAMRIAQDPYGNPFPYTSSRMRKHNKPWWYVPTGKDMNPDETYYLLSYPGPVKAGDVPTVYHITDQPAHSVAQAMNKDVVLRPDTMSVSVGDAIAQSDAWGKVRISSSFGSSGGPVAKLGKEPLVLYGTHVKGKWDEERLCGPRETNYNYCHRVTEPHWACAYVETILPILQHVPSSTWPGAYMEEALRSYLVEMANVIKAQNLWPVVETFRVAQGWPPF